MTVSTGTTGGPGPLDAVGDAWLGTGVRFPLRPRGAGGGGEAGALAWVGGEALIRQSIETILDTEPGERVMRPSFGCGLRRYLMTPNTAATRTALSEEISEALTRWEPRIRVTEVAVTPGEEPTLVWIDIAYVRLVDLRPDRLVYPFYLR
ncbi:GPW/gp25 family protein [Streptomyces sp. NBC_01408]|uniref:GPW/gp25 family protein n=1 Tax=Streptomyces sp. NBC_01408 TaxID=2903855 RepID=UPI00224DD6CC|nr:GPW/gp25 family protein [Streptomyces sp. NBC_01408]MCX4695762.1 GPW/gp25 family protein [Streptomyces sp. NBC_01408]